MARGSQFRAARSRGVSAVSIEAADAKKPPTPSAPLTSTSASFRDFRSFARWDSATGSRAWVPETSLKTASTVLRRGDVVVAIFVPHSTSSASKARSTALAFVPVASGVSPAARTSVVVEPLTAATTMASLARSAWAICDGAVTTPQLGSGVSQV